jgi:hypothetical protein
MATAGIFGPGSLECLGYNLIFLQKENTKQEVSVTEMDLSLGSVLWYLAVDLRVR